MSTYSYQVGVNLGGWLSQREVAQGLSGLDLEAHRSSFITKEDIQRIADWGFDHVRLPFDYELLEDDESPFQYKEDGFAWIDRCLDWCRDSGLGIVLDFHRAPGQNYAPDAPNPLLHDSNNRRRYLAIWRELANRYKNIREGLVFELLNEVVDNTCYLYKNLIRDGLTVIRAIDSQRVVIVGGNQYNSVFALKELPLYDDPHVIYNFHFYEPIPFTHQRAYFSEDMQAYATTVTYPGTFPELSSFLDKHPQYAAKNSAYVWTVNDQEQMIRNLEEARLFLEHTGKRLYCGEFGAIHGTPQASKLAWLHDLTELLQSYGIGRAYWSYKEMDYGLVDLRGNVLDSDVIQAVVRGNR